MALTLGFSSCPNDTFMFDALVHARLPGAPGVVPTIEDIEALNERACGPDASARLDVTKLSVGALPEALGVYAVLATGAALGRACGPLVVRRAARDDLRGASALEGRRVAVPGLRTTAWRLLQAFVPGCVPVAMRFDRIMAAVASGDVEAGLVIHEGRFTYRDHDLHCLADLGELWEADTGLPVPLGVITARRDLGDASAAAIEAAIGASVGFAVANPEVSRPWVRQLAIELGDDVIRQHIALYVNASSLGLDLACRRAITTLLARCGCDASPWR
jgi:1,4-dihydroxy-6-naphthoate synthase